MVLAAKIILLESLIFSDEVFLPQRNQCLEILTLPWAKVWCMCMQQCIKAQAAYRCLSASIGAIYISAHRPAENFRVGFRSWYSTYMINLQPCMGLFSFLWYQLYTVPFLLFFY